jgi:hypothetical protein
VDHRPWVAAVLSFLQPGLGHVYLRAWTRAVSWFLAWLAVVVALVDVPVPALTVEDLLATASQLFVAVGGLELLPSLLLAAVTAFAMVDAYRLGDARGRPDADGPTCPACGKELDEELDFCPWCTTELEWERPEESTFR